MEKTALVTGGAGFIGSHVVDLLLTDGWRVRILDNLSSGSMHNLNKLANGVDLVVGDIRNADACRAACAGVDSVFHLAALASVVNSVADPITSNTVNVGGTLNMLVAARDAGARRFVFSSSASVYGNSETVPTSEEQPISPESPYATDKASGELYCRNFWKLYGLETVVLRYFNVFGPRQSANSGYAAAIPAFVQAARTGKAPTVFGDGGQTRDFVYVADVANANLRAAKAPDAAGGTFNVAGGREITVLRLLTEIEQLTGCPMRPDFQPARAGEVRRSVADISRARQILGAAPRVSLTEGLGHTIGGMLRVPQGEAQRPLPALA